MGKAQIQDITKASFSNPCDPFNVRRPVIAAVENSYAGRSDSSFIPGLVDELDWAVQRMLDTGQATFAGTDTIQQTQQLFRTCVLRNGLDDYSIKRLVREPRYLQGLEVPPLVSVLKLDTQDEDEHEMRWSARRVNLLQNLLDHGHDPNEVYFDTESGIDTTPWCELAKRLMPCPRLEQGQPPSDYPQRPLMDAVSRGVISMLLDNGADPNATVEGEDSSEPRVDQVLPGLLLNPCPHVAGRTIPQRPGHDGAQGQPRFRHWLSPATWRMASRRAD